MEPPALPVAGEEPAPPIPIEAVSHEVTAPRLEPVEEPEAMPPPLPTKREEEAEEPAEPIQAPPPPRRPEPDSERETVRVEEAPEPPEVAPALQPAVEVEPPPAELPAEEKVGPEPAGSDDWAVELEVPEPATPSEAVAKVEVEPGPGPASPLREPAPRGEGAGLEEMLFPGAATDAAAQAGSEEPPPPVAAPLPVVASPGGFGLRHVALFVIGALLAGGGGYLMLAHLLRPGSAPPVTVAAAPEASPRAEPGPSATPVSTPSLLATEEAARATPTDEVEAARPAPPEPDRPAQAAAPEVSPPTTVAEAPPPSTQAVAPPAATPPPPVSVATPKPTPAAARAGSGGAPVGVAQLLNQAELARMGERWDDAVAYYDAVLGREPDNAEALQGKARTLAAREMASRRFQESATVVAGRDGKKPSGSDEADLSAHIDFEISPVSPRVGDRYSARVYLTNDGRKELEISLVSIVVTKDGVPTARNLTITERLAPGARTFLEDVSDEWSEGTQAWQLDVTVKTTHGELIRSRVVWK